MAEYKLQMLSGTEVFFIDMHRGAVNTIVGSMSGAIVGIVLRCV